MSQPVHKSPSWKERIGLGERKTDGHQARPTKHHHTPYFTSHTGSTRRKHPQIPQGTSTHAHHHHVATQSHRKRSPPRLTSKYAPASPKPPSTPHLAPSSPPPHHHTRCAETCTCSNCWLVTCPWLLQGPVQCAVAALSRVGQDTESTKTNQDSWLMAWQGPRNAGPATSILWGVMDGHGPHGMV